MVTLILDDEDNQIQSVPRKIRLMKVAVGGVSTGGSSFWCLWVKSFKRFVAPNLRWPIALLLGDLRSSAVTGISVSDFKGEGGMGEFDLESSKEEDGEEERDEQGENSSRALEGRILSKSFGVKRECATEQSRSRIIKREIFQKESKSPDGAMRKFRNFPQAEGRLANRRKARASFRKRTTNSTVEDKRSSSSEHMRGSIPSNKSVKSSSTAIVLPCS